MGVSDAGGHNAVPAAHLLVKIFRDIRLGLPEGGVKALGVGLPQIQKINGVVQNGLNRQPVLIILLHPGESLEGDLDIPVEPVNLLVLLIEVHQELELGVERSGVRLDVHLERLPGGGLGKQLHLPVVHVHALSGLIVEEKEELGILPIVPLLDLGADLHPDRPARQLLGNGYLSPEPIVLVRTVPVHGLAVEGLPRAPLALRLGGVEEKSLLVLPVRNGLDIANTQLVEVVADHLDPLVNEIHMRFST